MIFSTFGSYYFHRDTVSWTAWDPNLQHRSKKEASPDEIVDIDEAAHTYQVPETVKESLDTLITPEVYKRLLSSDENEFMELKDLGFKIVKTGKVNRVVCHKSCPEWLIKVGIEAERLLAMEGPVKISQALQQENKKATNAWLPLRNQNLLRASGRSYFVKQLSGLEPKDQKLFDFAEEYLYECPHAQINAQPHQKYFAISRKKSTFTGKETVEFIRDQEENVQRLIAQKIVKFIKCTRMHDWHRENLLLSKEAKSWRFEIIDSEPLGVLIDKEDTGAHLFESDEHVLLGLIAFRDWYCRDNGLTIMTEEINMAIVTYLNEHPEIDAKVTKDLEFVDRTPATACQITRMIALIFVSILFPVLPLVLLITAIFQTCCCQKEVESTHSECVTA
jgi:hypothetical protein